MVRSLLVRGMLAGLVAGVLAFVFATVFGEPPVEGAIAFEERLAAAAGEAPGVELVGRGVQGTLGLAVAVLVYGAALGGLFALVYAAVHGRVGRLGPRATAAVLALAGFVVVVVMPFLKYPANPPASSVDDTIGQRTGLYIVMVAGSVLLAVAAAAAARRLAARFGTWNGTLLACGAYLVAVGVLMALLPPVRETPQDFPATVLYDFRLASIGGQLVLWAGIGLVFGALVDGRSPAGRRAESTAAAGRP